MTNAKEDTASTETTTTAMRPAPLLGEVAVAELIGVSVHTLRHWRVAKTGPKFSKVGRAVRYRLSDIDTYISNVAVQTTEA